MPAFNIAFDPPERTGGREAASRPIDLAHLARQTMGDPTLEAEVLALFAREARRAVDELSTADEEGRRRTAHRLKGAASGVGASAVVRAAAALEAAPGEPAALAALTHAVAEANDFICALSR